MIFATKAKGFGPYSEIRSPFFRQLGCTERGSTCGIVKPVGRTFLSSAPSRREGARRRKEKGGGPATPKEERCECALPHESQAPKRKRFATGQRRTTGDCSQV